MVLMPRFVLAALLLAAWQSLRSGTLRCTRDELVQGVVIGLFSSAGMICQSDALQFTSASTSAFLTQLYVVFIPVYLMVRTRRNPGAGMWTPGDAAAARRIDRSHDFNDALATAVAQ